MCIRDSIHGTRMRYRFEPAIFDSTPLDKRDWRWHLTSAFSQRLRKYTFTAVHTKTHKRRFQIYPLWRAFSNLCVYGERFHRLRVEGRPKRIKKFAFTSVCVYNHHRVDGALSSNDATKTSLENKHLGNGDYFVIIASFSHPLLSTKHAANGW